MPGPPVIVTNVPFASTAARWIPNVTFHVAESSEKWSRGTDNVTHSNRLSGQGSVDTCRKPDPSAPLPSSDEHPAATATNNPRTDVNATVHRDPRPGRHRPDASY